MFCEIEIRHTPTWYMSHLIEISRICISLGSHMKVLHTCTTLQLFWYEHDVLNIAIQKITDGKLYMWWRVGWPVSLTRCASYSRKMVLAFRGVRLCRGDFLAYWRHRSIKWSSFYAHELSRPRRKRRVLISKATEGLCIVIKSGNETILEQRKYLMLRHLEETRRFSINSL